MKQALSVIWSGLELGSQIWCPTWKGIGRGLETWLWVWNVKRDTGHPSKLSKKYVETHLLGLSLFHYAFLRFMQAFAFTVVHYINVKDYNVVFKCLIVPLHSHLTHLVSVCVYKERMLPDNLLFQLQVWGRHPAAQQHCGASCQSCLSFLSCVLFSLQVGAFNIGSSCIPSF